MKKLMIITALILTTGAFFRPYTKQVTEKSYAMLWIGKLSDKKDLGSGD